MRAVAEVGLGPAEGRQGVVRRSGDGDEVQRRHQPAVGGLAVGGAVRAVAQRRERVRAVGRVQVVARRQRVLGRVRRPALVAARQRVLAEVVAPHHGHQRVHVDHLRAPRAVSVASISRLRRMSSSVSGSLVIAFFLPLPAFREISIFG